MTAFKVGVRGVDFAIFKLIAKVVRAEAVSTIVAVT